MLPSNKGYWDSMIISRLFNELHTISAVGAGSGSSSSAVRVTWHIVRTAPASASTAQFSTTSRTRCSPRSPRSSTPRSRRRRAVGSRPEAKSPSIRVGKGPSTRSFDVAVKPWSRTGGSQGRLTYSSQVMPSQNSIFILQVDLDYELINFSVVISRILELLFLKS